MRWARTAYNLPEWSEYQWPDAQLREEIQPAHTCTLRPPNGTATHTWITAYSRDLQQCLISRPQLTVRHQAARQRRIVLPWLFLSSSFFLSSGTYPQCSLNGIQKLYHTSEKQPDLKNTCPKFGVSPPKKLGLKNLLQGGPKNQTVFRSL